jgi:Holliday junction DNA helicase RuvA
MIVTLDGTLTAVSQTFAVIDVGGIGLRAFVPTSTSAHLPGPGQRVRLYTHLHVREDDLSLYGFASAGELELFEQLLRVGGLGPAKALGILSAASVDTIRSYIAGEDTAALARLPGIGQRTAARIVLDLKGKLVSAVAAGGEENAELLAWLTSLGFSTVQAQGAVAKLPRDNSLSFEEKARRALERLRPE